MKNIRVDAKARQRCWHCGGMSFTEKRTLRSKAAVGVGALLTKKKLKCQSCGEYNDAGNAQPYKGPSSKRAAKKSGALELDTADAAELDQQAPALDLTDQLTKLAGLRDSGVLTDEEFATQKAKLLA